MSDRRRRRVAAAIALIAAVALGAAASSSSSAAERAGFRALSGPAASAFVLPTDVELVRSLDLSAYGLRYERYQQRFGPAAARVLGGQLSVYRDSSGIRSVTGSHYPEVTPTNRVNVTAAQARERSEQELGREGERTTELWIDPATGRYQWRVETRRFGFRRLHVIEAQTGQVLQRLDLLMTDHGVGVKGDTKSVLGLTRRLGSTSLCSGSHYELEAADGRQTTLDARNGTFFLYPVCDADDHWVLPGTSSPGQPALVDAQFYANVTDDYYLQRHGFDWLVCYPGGFLDGPGMRSGAHVGVKYSNAFWDGRYTAYGDGDGVSFREFSGGLDVVAHEHTHGVTDCTSDLAYSNESGALNEAFSDMLAAAAEFFHGSTSAESPDYFVGEDVYLPADPGAPGFRNMADPEEDADPDHYSERYTGTDDNGGVHTNSGIPNHAFYLLAEGGRNASCASPSSHNAGHCADGDTDDGVVVTGIGLGPAERITFLAYIGLPTNATMCNARAAVEAQAVALHGSGSQQAISARDAYVAVGLTDAVCGFAPPTNTPPTADEVDVTTAYETPVEVRLLGADAETCELTFQIVAGPTNGSAPGSVTDETCAAGSPNRDAATVLYTPASGFAGADSFTYSVTDGDGAMATATVSVTVEPQGGTATTMHVGDLDGTSTPNRKNWRATVYVLVHDGSHEVVSGATVTGAWSGGAKGTSSCTTSGAGSCSVSKNVSSKNASVTFTVTGVTQATLGYEQTDNHDGGDGDSDGTTVVVQAP